MGPLKWLKDYFYLFIILVLSLLGLGSYFKGRASVKAEQKEERFNTLKEVREIEGDVRNEDDDSLVDSLTRK